MFIQRLVPEFHSNIIKKKSVKTELFPEAQFEAGTTTFAVQTVAY